MPDKLEEKVWQILFDARDILAVNKDEGKQDALADIAKEVVALFKKSPVDLNELLFRCDHCGEILIPKVDENNDEEILIEPCNCISDD